MSESEGFYFATCERQRALLFIQKMAPEANVTAESAADLLDIIAADELRVCDPDFHSAMITQGRNFRDDTVARAEAALRKAGIVFGRM